MARGNRDGVRVRKRAHYGAADALLRYIATYESDTFSASGQRLTARRAEQIAAKVIKAAREGLDGCDLTGALYDLREK